MDIPFLKFPRDKIIEIIPAAYQNEAKRIHIPGIDPKITPSSPEGIAIPVPNSTNSSVPGSGTLSPNAGAGVSSPTEPVEQASAKVINKATGFVADKVDDED